MYTHMTCTHTHTLHIHTRTYTHTHHLSHPHTYHTFLSFSWKEWSVNRHSPPSCFTLVNGEGDCERCHGKWTLLEYRAEEVRFSADWAISSGFCERVTWQCIHVCRQQSPVSTPGNPAPRRRCTALRQSGLSSRSPLSFTVFGALACRVLCGSELTSFITSLTSQGLSLKKCL